MMRSCAVRSKVTISSGSYSSSSFSSSSNNNTNNNGNINFEPTFEKKKTFKFSKIRQFNSIDTDILFIKKNDLIYFDNKGTIFRINENFETLWKVNHYSKNERKLNPILYFNYIDNKIKNNFGIMSDDLLAGIFTAIIIAIPMIILS